METDEIRGELDRDDFMGVLNEEDDLLRTEQIAEHVGCSEEVAKEWMFKMKEEGEVVSKPRGDQGLLWVKKT
jgi:DNA-binding IscR family transcriptional regulator